MRRHAAIPSSQYSCRSAPRTSRARIRQLVGNSCRWTLGRGRGLLSESRVPGLKLAWGRPLIVVGNPLPQDRPQILFVLRDHTIHAFTADRSHQSFTEPLAFGACTGVVELSARMPPSHRQLPPKRSSPDRGSGIGRCDRSGWLLETAARPRLQSDGP
jgi:hypothetical protein